MAVILIEARSDPAVQPVLDAIAKTCRGQGHRVVRWRGPLSGRVPHSKRAAPCDLAILWNGTHRKYARLVRRLRRSSTPILFSELGWFPQRETFQIDHQGINAAASWVCEPLGFDRKDPLPVRPDGDLLVLLQLDRDTQITHHSPWFHNMYSFVQHLGRSSALPIRVRRHPLRLPDKKVVNLVKRLGGTWDRSSSLQEAFRSCKAVACINSSGGVEAMAHRLPVLCFGKAVYRQPQAVYRLDSDITRTHAVTRSLARGQCHLVDDKVKKVLTRIRAHQWTIGQIPQRLPPIVDAALGRSPSALRCPQASRAGSLTRAGRLPTFLNREEKVA